MGIPSLSTFNFGAIASQKSFPAKSYDLSSFYESLNMNARVVTTELIGSTVNSSSI